MPSVRRSIVVGIVTMVLGLVCLVPARFAYQLVATPEFVLSGIEGSIWNGRARAASIGGLYLRDVAWKVRLHRLLLGRLAYAVTASPSGGFIDGEVAAGIGGSLYLGELRASIPLAALEPMIRVRGIRGMANATFESLHISQGFPVKADGNIEVAGLLLPPVSRAPIGGFNADFFTENGAIIASVEDTNAIVDLAGRLLLNEDRSYEFLGQVAPKPETPADLRQQMQLLGSANERGQHELRLEGSL